MKKTLGVDVLQASRERISYTFDNFERIYVSFSGGKDSSVMLHLVMDEAIKRNRTVGILFVDLEGQYKLTIDHILEMRELYKDNTEWYWVCLPIALRNAVSVYQPKWQCWNPDAKDIWIRQPPIGAITDQEFFPFFRRDMEFEDFVPQFGEWYSQGNKTACCVGIRSDESLNRYRTIKNEKKTTYNGKMWTTLVYKTHVYNIYPIYDWRTRDIWIYTGKEQKCYNKLYDLMSKAGLTIHQQRICQPYGDDQRKGLWLFHIIEPETWSKIVARVSGANSGAEFVQYRGNVSGYQQVSKPDNITWEKFAEILLGSMPDKMKDHYANKIFVFLEWYRKNGWTDSDGIRRFDCPDYIDIKMESGREAPSWRRICKMLLRNDYWAKGIGFSQTKDGFFYKRYMDRIKKSREERRKENLRKSGNWRGFI